MASSLTHAASAPSAQPLGRLAAATSPRRSMCFVGTGSCTSATSSTSTAPSTSSTSSCRWPLPRRRHAQRKPQQPAPQVRASTRASCRARPRGLSVPAAAAASHHSLACCVCQRQQGARHRVAARVGNGGAPNDGGYDGDSSSEEHANGNSPGGPSGGSSSSSRFGSRGFDLGSMREPRFTRGAGQGDHGPWQEGSTGKAPADASSSNASEKNTDSEVQEALADILNMEVRKEEVKQEILADLELKKEQLRLIGQELADDFEKEIALDKIRTELASNMSLADTMSRFQELEDEVQALRDSVAADKEELLDWEESTAAARSRSLFFKELYTVKRPKGDDEHGSDSGVTRRHRRTALTDSNASDDARPQSPLLFYTLVYLSAVTGVALAADVVSGQPDVWQDVLYTLLVVALSYSATMERYKLQQQRGKPTTRD